MISASPAPLATPSRRPRYGRCRSLIAALTLRHGGRRPRLAPISPPHQVVLAREVYRVAAGATGPACWQIAPRPPAPSSRRPETARSAPQPRRSAWSRIAPAPFDVVQADEGCLALPASLAAALPAFAKLPGWSIRVAGRAGMPVPAPPRSGRAAWLRRAWPGPMIAPAWQGVGGRGDPSLP